MVNKKGATKRVKQSDGSVEVWTLTGFEDGDKERNRIEAELELLTDEFIEAHVLGMADAERQFLEDHRKRLQEQLEEL